MPSSYWIVILIGVIAVIAAITTVYIAIETIRKYERREIQRKHFIKTKEWLDKIERTNRSRLN